MKSRRTASAADQHFLRQFETQQLPFAQWTHRAHVRVAYLYLRQYPFRKALSRMRHGIKTFNAANKVPESATRGYNETTTHAFLHLVAAVMRAYAKTHPVSDSNQFCDTHPQLLSRHVLRFFYSPRRRMHPLAKTKFVQPDLAPLPRIRGGRNDCPAGDFL